ncbi:(Fe-S)-binding protein [Thermicanus aegyptius]|uniref:(Fe-S)-binding protein n=1 Tax=Thermicanus aegyptius TaxID=94009 RepID=UPI000347F934|nr:(Fe-S)-binding protein [Thermicanus aegyptius]
MKASLFITCLADLFYPQVGKSVVEVLEHYGVEVDFPMGQTCCGQPAYNSGYHEEAKKAAEQMIRVFEGSTYVVSPSGSCAAMFREIYPQLFREDEEWRERAEKLAQKTYEFSEFLVKVLGVKVEAAFPATATYHHSCHMNRFLGVKEEPITLLNQVEGLTLKDLPYSHDCCGFGGTFSVKMKEISTAMADTKLSHVEETDTEILIGSDLGCLMHLGGRLHRQGKEIKTMHVAEVLAKGLKK